MAESLESFSIKGSDKGFDTKKKDIFKQLGSLETKYNNNLIDRFSTDDNKKEHCDVDSKECRSESFRVPSNTPPTRGRERSSRNRQGTSIRKGQEDYHETERDNNESKKHWNNKRKSRQDYKNPAKWTKYSLEDTDVGSESQNKSIALQFLAEQSTRNRESEAEEVVNLDDKITFSKPSTNEINESESKPKMYGSVYRMPECVVGSKKQPKQNLEKKQRGGSNISAGGHVQLEFEFEDDDDKLKNETNKQEDKEKIKFKKNKQKKNIRKRDDENDVD